MIAVFTASEIKSWENYSRQHYGLSNTQLMQQASAAFVKSFLAVFKEKKPVLVLCGKGKNGGDGLYVAKLLLEAGWELQLALIHGPDSGNEDQQTALNYFLASHSGHYLNQQQPALLKGLPADTLIIDAILGSGTQGTLRDPELSWAVALNACSNTVIALDVPTGLPTDSVALVGEAVMADHTFTMACFKPAFVFPESAKNNGQIHLVDIGLHPDFLPLQQPWAKIITPADLKSSFPERQRFSHKGTYGYLLLIAGRFGKTGAASLATEAAFRVGAGKINVHLPEKSVNVLQFTVPEAMVSVDPHPEYWTTQPDNGKYSAAAVGPGIGTHSDTALAFGSWLEQQDQPIVIDADAINIMAEQPFLQNHIPANSILTPHMLEFDRMTGHSNSWPIRLEKARKFAEMRKCYVVLKNAYSFICTPDGQLLLNTNGNPGMATAGSGDVLTGIIAGLLAQGLSAYQSVITGVFLHGLAGDLAAQEKGQESLLARDIIAALPQAISKLRN